ncbi:MAG: LLM class F420-dependent oxidoreductase [Acidimicrobiia bacterium]
MRVGITMFATDVSIGVVELARACEARGFDSLWLPEHTHIPLSRRTLPPTGETVLGDRYLRSLDPLVALTAAATATTDLRLGTAVALVAQRDPVVTAKAVATLDLVSGGRFSLGIGFGWNEDEMETHGVDPRRRRSVAREHVLAMRALWEQEEASFEGEHVRLAPSWSWPKPVQAPLPVLVGGMAGPGLFAHVAEYAQGWMPVGGRALGDSIARLHEAVAAAGRDPSGIEVVPVVEVVEAGKVAHLRDAGATGCALRVPSAPADEVLRVLDAHAALLATL